MDLDKIKMYNFSVNMDKDRGSESDSVNKEFASKAGNALMQIAKTVLFTPLTLGIYPTYAMIKQFIDRFKNESEVFEKVSLKYPFNQKDKLIADLNKFLENPNLPSSGERKITKLIKILKDADEYTYYRILKNRLSETGIGKTILFFLLEGLAYSYINAKRSEDQMKDPIRLVAERVGQIKGNKYYK